MGCHDERDRRDEPRRDASSSQDKVYERSSASAIAIDEGVNRLELRVDQRGLRHRGKEVLIAKVCQVFQQRRDILWSRRNEIGRQWVGTTASYPILHLARRTTEGLYLRVLA